MPASYQENMAIRLEKCRFFARHGFLPQEKIAGNEFEISAEVKYCLAGLDDSDLSSTISYADIYEICKKAMGKPFNLLENVARYVADEIYDINVGITHISVEVRKITPPIPGITGSASVMLTRSYDRIPGLNA